MSKNSKTHGNRRYDVNENDVVEWIDSDIDTCDVIEHFKFWLDCYSRGSLSISERARSRAQRFIAGLH